MAYTSGKDISEDDDPQAVNEATKRMVEDAKDDDMPLRVAAAEARSEPLPEP